MSLYAPMNVWLTLYTRAPLDIYPTQCCQVGVHCIQFAQDCPFSCCSGVQGAIYELKSPDGKDSGQLLKVLKFKAVLPITGNDIGALHSFLSFCAPVGSCGARQFTLHISCGD